MAGTSDAYLYNLEMNFSGTKSGMILKLGEGAFKTFKVCSGIGIVHQVNLEHIATVSQRKNKRENPTLLDTLVVPIPHDDDQ